MSASETSASEFGADAPTASHHQLMPEPEMALAYSETEHVDEPVHGGVLAALRDARPVLIMLTAGVAVAGMIVAAAAASRRAPAAVPAMSVSTPSIAVAEPSDLAASPLPERMPTSPQIAQREIQPEPTTTQNGDDEQFVALSFSPRSQQAAYGRSGTQDRADQIALNECKAHTGDDLCLVVARMHHGCVSLVFDDRGAWAGASGADQAAAEAHALALLPSATHGGAKCST